MQVPDLKLQREKFRDERIYQLENQKRIVMEF